MKTVSGKETLTAGTNTILFPAALDTAEYALVFRCYDATTLTTIACRVDPAYYTTSGFRAVPIADAVIEYQVEEYGSAINLLAETGILSRDWTVGAWYAEVVRDLGLNASVALYGERFNIHNRAVAKAVASNSAILGNYYKSTQTSTDSSATEVALSNVRMQMGAPEQRFVVESAITDYVDMVEYEEYGVFRTGAFQNVGRIVWTRQGDTLLFKKSTSLSNYGTRSFRYCRMPQLRTANTQLVDFPDSFMHLSLVEGKRICAERYREIVGNIQYPEDTGEGPTKKAVDTANLESPNALKEAL